MSDDVVLYDTRDGVAVLTLNRPDRLNAWTGELERRYFDLLEQADDDADVAVVVVTGAGRGWCAGADMDVLQGIGADASGQGAAGAVRRKQSDTLAIRKPVIAAVNGACAGIGLAQALMCDLRFAAAGAKFTTAFVRRGLIAEHGTSWMLPRLVGPSRALDLLLSGRVVVAEEALAMGLVDRVYPPEELLPETLAYARDVAEHCSPASMAIIKRQVWGHLEVGLEDALAESAGLMLQSFTRPDFDEGVTSFLEKRPPSFPPLPPRSAT